jgi:hypothetical protein
LSEEEFSEDESDDQEKIAVAEGESSILTERRALAAENLVPPLPAHEYGIMPPMAYSNSQEVSAPSIATETVPNAEAWEAVNPIAVSTVVESSHATHSTRPIRKPILVRDRYDGVDSDDESEPENDGVIWNTLGEDEDEDESDEDRPTVVGEIEVDMEAEEEDFLRFSREALGITAEQWQDILTERADRGGSLLL